MQKEVSRMSDRELTDAFVVGDLANPERWNLVAREFMRRGLAWANLVA